MDFIVYVMVALCALFVLGLSLPVILFVLVVACELLVFAFCLLIICCSWIVLIPAVVIAELIGAIKTNLYSRK